MTDLKNNDFSDVAFNRHTVRDFDKDFKISRDEIKEMITEAAKAPSTSNLQSWHFVATDTEAGKKKLHQFYFPANFKQIDHASVIVQVFANNQSYKRGQKWWENELKQGHINEEQYKQATYFVPLFEKLDMNSRNYMTAIDASLAAMQLMLVARAHGYVTNPMSGYDPTKVASTLGLDPTQYSPVMAIAIGKPAAGTKVAPTPRYDTDEFLEFE